jgi:hypothetical protein
MNKHHPTHYLHLIFWLGLWIASPCLAQGQPEPAYQQAVTRIIEGFDQGTAEPFNQALDAEGIVAKATQYMVTDLGWVSRTRRTLVMGVKQSLGEKLLKQMAPGSYVKLLKLSIRDEEEARALLRFDYGEYGTGYFELMLTLSPAGKVHIVDMYDYAAGQRYTASLRQTVSIMAPTPTAFGKLYDVASDRKDVSDALKNIFKLHRQQEHAALAQSFLSQDESVRGSRVLNLIAISSANVSGDEALYRRTLANLDHYHGDNEKLFLVLLDYYFFEEKYDRVLAGLEKIKTLFGVQDAFLYVVQSNTLNLMNDHQGALQAAERAIALEPDYELGYLSQFSARVAVKDYSGAVKTAATMEERFDYDFSPEAISALEEYVEFAESKPYRQWRASL